MTDTENTKYKNYLKLCKHLASFLLSIEFYYTRFFEMGGFCFVMFFFSSLFCIAFIDRLSTGAVVGVMMEARRCGRKRTLSYWNISDIFLLSFFHPVTISRE